jgi:bifunctional DNase/RNase
MGRLLHLLFLQGSPNMVIALLNKIGFYLSICIVLKKCVYKQKYATVVVESRLPRTHSLFFTILGVGKLGLNYAWYS